MRQRQSMSLRMKYFVVGGVSALVIGVLITFFNIGNPFEASAISTGGNDPSSSTTTGSGSSWSYTSRSYTSNNSWSYTYLSTNSTSSYLMVTNFGFAIPSGATIQGITVDIEHYGGHRKMRDNSVMLTKNGSSYVGSDYGKSSTWANGYDEDYSYGGTSDLWGESWSESDINSSNFGVGISVENFSSSRAGYAYIDDITVTVEYTTGGGGGGSSTGPGGLTTELELWLDANEGVTGTTQISSWSDQSGNSNTASMSTSTYRPSLETDYLNFNNVIDFDGGDEYMEGSAGGHTDDIFMVLIPDNTINYSLSDETPFSVDADQTYPSAWIGLGAATSGLSNEVLTYGVGSSSTWRRAQTSTSVSYSSGVPMILNVSNNDGGSSTSIFYNQTNVSNGTNGSYRTAEEDEAYRIGGNCYYWGGSYYNGKIAEVITFSDDLSTAERTKVASYLAIKYGITIEDDYDLSDGTTVWNSSSNSGYHNDMAGVARDDDSNLDQQKSESQNSDAAVTVDKGGAFSTDLDAIIWGNDDGSLTKGTSNGPANFPQASNRTWKVELNGTPGTVSVDFDLATLGMEGGAAGDYALLIDNNTNFTSGASEHTTGATLNGSTLTFTGVSFTDGYYFTLGSDFAVVDGDPGGVSSNLALWLKAGAGISGSSNITEWADQSGNGYNAEDASSTTRPNLETATINYNDAVNFDGTDEYLQGSSGGYSQEVFMVLMPDADVSYSSSSQVPYSLDASNPSSAAAWLGLGSGTSGLSNEVVYYASGGSSEWRRGETSTSTTYSQNEPFIFSVTNNNSGSSTSLYINASQVDNTTGSGSYVNAESNRQYRIGGNIHNWGGSYFNGQIAEVVTYSSTLSSTDRNKVQSYLSMKYGITQSDNYTLSDGTEIWNATTNSDYHNRIIYIGRDDNAELEQKQTISMHDQDDVLIIAHGAIAASNSANANGFSSDGSYLIMGDNDGVLTGAHNPDYGTTSNGHAVNGRIHRTWKVHESGDVGTVRLKFDLSTYPGVIGYVGTYDFSKIRLVTDTDTKFKVGAYGVAPVAYDAVEETVEFEYDFSSGTSYMSLGTLGEFSDAPLPVEFTYFNANLQAEGVELKWGTAMEENNEYFAIERSADGDVWEEIGQVQGAGSTDVPQNYVALDENPLAGLSYYRIRQVDFSGESETTDVRSVNRGNRTSDDLIIKSLYPNPIQSQVTIEFVAPSDGSASLELINASGALLRREQIGVSEGENSYVWDLSDAQRGNYLIRLNMDALSVRKKVIKQ